jgi:hypothetical protein
MTAYQSNYSFILFNAMRMLGEVLTTIAGCDIIGPIVVARAIRLLNAL